MEQKGDKHIHWIDNLRWVTVISVLIYHVFYLFNNKGVFGGIGGFVDDPKGQPQDVVEYILYPWFMMILFLVAGISARYALEKKCGTDFIKSRTTKLLVPSTIGLLVFQWMVGYFNTRAANPFGEIPALVRWPLYAISGCGPLWFIQELWVFSLLIVLVRKLDRNNRFYNWCGKASLPAVILAGGVLVFLSSQFVVRNPGLESMDGILNLYRPVTYFTLFLMGYFVFSHDAVQDKVEKIHLPMLLCAVAAGAVLIWKGWGLPYTAPEYLSGWLNCLYAWLMILAMLGCFKAWFDRTDNFCGYMSRSSFGIYVVHYIVVVSFGTMFKEYTQLAPWLIYTLLTAVTLLLSPALFELLRRIPFIRWCVFGIKSKC